MNLTDTKNSPGVVDLPMKVRTAFAAAILKENEGKHDKAEEWLDRAIKYEQEVE